VAQALVTKIGPRIVMVTGLALVGFGQIWYTQIPVDGHYFWNLFPGFFATGIGIVFGFVPVNIVGLAGIKSSDAGLASGLVNTTQQIGGAVGTAIVTSAWLGHLVYLPSGQATKESVVAGQHAAFWSGAVIAGLGVVATLALVRDKDLALDAEAVPVPA
jgi:MFS family permease